MHVSRGTENYLEILVEIGSNVCDNLAEGISRRIVQGVNGSVAENKQHQNSNNLSPS